MQNILLLFARFGSFITFVFMTIVCFLLIIKYNQTQQSIFVNSSNYYANKLDSRMSKWQRYLSLQEVNDSLAHHNASLMETFIRSTRHLRNNHVTLDIGAAQGIQKDMGVIGDRGLIGIVREVSSHYAHVISVLNSQTRISCTVKPHAYAGHLVWKDIDAEHMTLMSIPKHVSISIGDTVSTNGYSTIFPAGIDVGRVVEFSVEKGSSNYNIKVRLFNNVPNTKVGYVIINHLSEERRELESVSDE